MTTNNYPTDLYSKKVMEHFYHPKNMGVIKNPDGEAVVGNPICGDVMKMYIKVKNIKGINYIDRIKFQTLGCGAAIATSSMVSVMVKGKKLSDAEKMTNKALIKALDGLPPVKIHCSLLAVEALKNAISDFKSK